MSKASLGLLVVLVALIIGGLFIHKARLRSASESEAKSDAIALLQHNTLIKGEWTYVSGLIERHHSAAVESAFKSGGLFAQDEFDDQAYQATLWKLVAESAAADKKSDVVNALPGEGDTSLYKKPEPGPKSQE